MIEKSLVTALEPIIDEVVELKKKLDSIVIHHGRDGKDAEPIDISLIIEEVIKRIPEPKDGKDAEPVVIADVVKQVLDLIPPPKDGKDADPVAIAKEVANYVDAEAIACKAAELVVIPAIEVNVDDVKEAFKADEEFVKSIKGEKGNDGECGPAGADGITTVEVVAKHDTTLWTAGIHRQNSIVQHFLGRLYVAKCDTTEEPGNSDHWQRLGLGGLRFTGGFKKDHDYEAGDIYVKDYSAFMWDGEKAHLIAARQKETSPIEVAKSLIAQPKFLDQVIDGLTPDLKQAVDVVISEEITKGIDDRFKWYENEDGSVSLFDTVKNVAISNVQPDAVKALIAAADAKDKLPPLTRFVGNLEVSASYVRGDVVNFGNQLFVCWQDCTLENTAQGMADNFVVMLASSVIGGSGGGGGGGGGGPVHLALNDLTDVDTHLSATGMLLTRQIDGTWKGQNFTRPLGWLSDVQAPADTPAGMVLGTSGIGEWEPMPLASLPNPTLMLSHLLDCDVHLAATGMVLMKQIDGTWKGANIFLDLNRLTDVTAPADTPAGKLLGTTAEGQWGPVDAPSQRLAKYTVATLPTNAVEGDMAFVTDGLARTLDGDVHGGGTVKLAVWYDGTAWVQM
jgi:hypothetical protein